MHKECLEYIHWEVLSHCLCPPLSLILSHENIMEFFLYYKQSSVLHIQYIVNILKKKCHFKCIGCQENMLAHFCLFSLQQFRSTH